MKLAIIAAALTKESNSFELEKHLIAKTFNVASKYENNHSYCDKNDIPNQFGNRIGILNRDLQCEMLNQHTVCSTACKDERKIEFECNCNRQVMTITVFDKTACHWKTLMDVQCTENKLEDSPMINHHISDTNNSFSEDLNSQNETFSQPSAEVETPGSFINDFVNDFVNENTFLEVAEVSSETTELDYDISYDIDFDEHTQSDSIIESNTNSNRPEANNEITGRHIPTCTTLEEAWNCSNKNLARYTPSSLVQTLILNFKITLCSTMSN